MLYQFCSVNSAFETRFDPFHVSSSERSSRNQIKLDHCFSKLNMLNHIPSHHFTRYFITLDTLLTHKLIFIYPYLTFVEQYMFKWLVYL